MNRAKLWVCWSAVAVLAASPLLAAKGRAAASSPKARPRIPIVIGLVTFNAVAAKADPKSDATAASHLFVAKLLDAVSAYGRSKSDRAYDVDFELVRGNYYQVLHWLRSGQIDGAVLSPFSLYVAQATTASWPAFEPMPVLEFPTAGLTPAEDGGRPYFRAYANGRFVSDPAASLELCLRDEPPCTFEFVNHLSTTGFIYPLLRIYQSKNPPEFKKLLSRGHFSLWHGATAAPHERTIQFTYGGSLVANTPAEQATWSPLFLGERFPRDVLILNCKTPSLQHVCSEVRAILQQYVSSKRPQAQPAEKNAPLVGYRTAEPFDPATQNELKEEIKQLRPRLAQYWNDWYVRGKFDFTVQEIVDLLMDDQTIANHRNAAIVLPGGGVRGAYQARILDELYDKYVLNQAAPKDEKQRLEINCIVGTSGGALMGYLAARRTPSDKDKLADLWEKNKKVVINPSQVFPFFSPLRTISILLAITLLGVIAAMLTRRIPASPGAPLFVTIGFAAIIIAAPAFIWRLSFVDLRYQPTWEPFFYA
ncbi:MAG TPA: patatin-like phospholipase family protein, partial [Thermoanaerobaculia bacterium]|nr:patatin-like phospholipase family protein [Thermoanaerobaculia bacterium]